MIRIIVVALTILPAACEQRPNEGHLDDEPGGRAHHRHPQIESSKIQKAEMLYDQGMVSEAKQELVDVIFGDFHDQEKAEAYFLLGNIAFTEERLSTALETWNVLINKYPDSQQAVLIKDKATELAEIVGETTEKMITNAVAKSYMRSGDFWSTFEDDKFNIDTSWIPRLEAGMHWYDKVITEFPQSQAAELAYTRKLKVFLGQMYKLGPPNRTEIGSIEIIKKKRWDNFFSKVLETFSSLKADFPEAESLQAFRFQIGQAYWMTGEQEKAEEWLNLVISVAGDSDTFYKDLAERRLKFPDESRD